MMLMAIRRRFLLASVVGGAAVTGVLATGALGQSPAGTGAPITITSPAAGSTVYGTYTSVAGTVGSDASGEPTDVQVDGQSAPVSNGAWSAFVPVSRGEQTITVTATDPAGVKSTASQAIFDDPESPHPGGYEPTLQPAPTTTTSTQSSTSTSSAPRVLCTVPKIAPNAKIQKAAREVAAAGCPIGAYAQMHSAKVPKGDLIKLRPGSGHRLTSGQRVALFASLGPAKASDRGRKAP